MRKKYKVIVDSTGFDAKKIAWLVDRFQPLADISFRFPGNKSDQPKYPDRKKKEISCSVREQDKSLPHAIICDLDGTLSLLNGRNPFDASRCDLDLLNEAVRNVLQTYKRQGARIILLSGREDKFREPTKRFLENHQVVYDKLLMRKTADNRKDSLIKKEIFEQEINGKYFVIFILDDRDQVVKMWRDELHLPCFQVFYGDFNQILFFDQYKII